MSAQKYKFVVWFFLLILVALSALYMTGVIDDNKTIQEPLEETVSDEEHSSDMKEHIFEEEGPEDNVSKPEPMNKLTESDVVITGTALGISDPEAGTQIPASSADILVFPLREFIRFAYDQATKNEEYPVYSQNGFPLLSPSEFDRSDIEEYQVMFEKTDDEGKYSLVLPKAYSDYSVCLSNITQGPSNTKDFTNVLCTYFFASSHIVEVKLVYGSSGLVASYDGALEDEGLPFRDLDKIDLSCTEDIECDGYPCHNGQCLIQRCTDDVECPGLCGLHLTPTPGFCTAIDII